MEWDLSQAHELVVDFAMEREWERFHTPKNLTMALAAEAGELLEVFRWLTPEESDSGTLEVRKAAEEELADVLIFALLLADRLGVDLASAVEAKVKSNADRYPAAEVRGSAAKYAGEGRSS